MATEDPIPPPDSQAVDVDAFREQMREAGVEEVVPKILATFSGDLSNQENRLRSALASGDPESVASIAHGFKSASGSVHAYRLQAILHEMEIRARETGLEACAPFADRAFEEIERVRVQLDALEE